MRKYFAEILLVSISAIVLVFIIFRVDFSPIPEETEIAEEVIPEPVLKFGLQLILFRLKTVLSGAIRTCRIYYQQRGFHIPISTVLQESQSRYSMSEK